MAKNSVSEWSTVSSGNGRYCWANTWFGYATFLC